ncbi:hypothetical protein EDB19DRAFT_1978128 [Suillus lakei]|nr:hypothetical protein EDB19DRAFT_1978128 [Suillus lakei]
MFWTLKEFVQALRDIVKIQQTVVEEHQILHRDCSLNNAMILDELDGSERFLIDWEFAVCITADHKYSIGGTGTVPFMSCGLLNQVAILQQQVNTDSKKASKLVKNSKTPKSSSNPEAPPISYVIQSYADDLESLGPNGMVHQEHVPNSLLDRWTSLDLASCATFKITLCANPADEKHLTDEFHPYFKDLIPLATEWCRVLVDNMVHPITFKSILGLLNSHLDKLPDNEELASTMTMLKNDAVALVDRVKGKWIASASFSAVQPKQQKSDHDASIPDTDHVRGKWIASEHSSAVAPKQQKSRHSDTKSDSALGSDT